MRGHERDEIALAASLSAQRRDFAAVSEVPVEIAEQVSAEAHGAFCSRLKRR
jgi:hypothetical protein